jgi:hypothetical protein
LMVVPFIANAVETLSTHKYPPGCCSLNGYDKEMEGNERTNR